MDFRFMDRHADKSARDDRETSKATNLNKHAGGRILRLESGLCKASKEIRLCAYRRSETQTRAKGAKRQNPKPKEVSYE